MTTRHPTTDDTLGHIKTQLAYARSDVKQAQLRGYSPEYYMGRVAALAGLIATLDPELQDVAKGNKFIADMLNFEDVPEYFTPGDEA